MDTRALAFPKARATVLERIERKRELKATEDRCRRAVRVRDQGRCRVPSCQASSKHLHHIVYRSHGGKWQTHNVVSLCQKCHGLVHAALIRIAGDADGVLTFEGVKE